MDSAPLVSVVIPTYRRGVLLRSAIESVCRQTYRNIEVLVVDDASNDNTAAIAASIGDSRIRCLRHDVNRGASAARNTGIREAKGAYIAFLDDDDEWRFDKLEKQLVALEGCDAVMCTSVSNGYPMRVHKKRSVTLEDLRRGSFNPSGLIAKSSILKELLFDESLRQGEDWDLFIRIAQRFSVGWIAEPLVAYNEASPNRVTSEESITADEVDKRTAVLRKHRDFFGEKWFNYHFADACLAYISRQESKLKCVGYALKRCGFRPVIAALAHRARRRIRRLIWTHRQTSGAGERERSARNGGGIGARGGAGEPVELRGKQWQLK